MSSLKELVELGKELGLTGNALNDFVKEEREKEEKKREIEREEKKREEEKEEKKREIEREENRRKEEREERKRQEDIEREERRLEREEKRLELEREKEEKRLQIERERLEIEREKEEKRLQIEREERKLDREHDLECKKLEAESKHKIQSKDSNSYNISKAIKMPKFDEKSDTMDAYIHRFEFLASNKNIDKKHWSLCLAENLSGSCLEVIQSMPNDDATDYEKLKTKLLERFKYNQEGYRKQFKSCKPKLDENFDTFFDKLGQSLDKWITASDIEKGDFNKLRCLILFEQLYETCNPNLVRFLKERNPSDEKEIKEHAHLYEKANPGAKLGRQETIDTAAVGIERRSRTPNRHFGQKERRWDDTPYRARSQHDSRRGAFQRPQYKSNYSDRGNFQQNTGRGYNKPGFNNFRRERGRYHNRPGGHFNRNRHGYTCIENQNEDPNNINGHVPNN